MGALTVIASCAANGNKNAKENICKKASEATDCSDHWLNVAVCGPVSKKMIMAGAATFNTVNVHPLTPVKGTDDTVITHKHNTASVLSDEDDDKEANATNIPPVK